MDLVANEKINIVPQKRVSVDGGDVMHIIKSSEPEFKSFQEAYFSIIKFEYIKAWKRHMSMTMNIIVPVGSVQFVFYNNQGKLLLNTTIGQENYSRLTVPPKIWFGFKGLYKFDSYVLNISNLEHDPQEVERKPLSAFDFLS